MTDPANRPALVTAHGSALEERARERLEALLDRHDLSPRCCARRLLIDEEYPHAASCSRVDGRLLIRWRPFGGAMAGRPQSGLLLLATYLHEQPHAHLNGRPGLDAAPDEVQTWYPQLPDREHGGAGGDFSTRLHLILCTLELDSLAHLTGEEGARLHLSRARGYRWIYGEVLAHTERLRDLNARHGLNVLTK